MTKPNKFNTQAEIKKGTGKPKFRVGDIVFRAKRPYRSFNDIEPPGRVVEVVTKTNLRGANTFYYQILWGSSRKQTIHSQHRLKLMTVSSSQQLT